MLFDRDETLPATVHPRVASRPSTDVANLPRWAVEPDGDRRGPFPVGTLVGTKYRVTGELGRGGTAIVYRATRAGFDRPIALKVLRPEMLEVASARERMLREARLLASLDTPSVPRVYEIGQLESGQLAVAMDLVEGLSLRQHLVHGGPLAVEEAVRIALMLLRGVDAAHRQGIVHRDLKPSNVILEDQGGILVPSLIDFGAAHPLDAASPALTASGSTIGTPGYMAPEQIACGDVTPRTDLYALGVILYEMLTGRRPYDGDPADLTRRVLTTDARPPSELRPGVPPLVDGAVLALLEREPMDRPFDAAHARGVLRAARAAAARAGEVPPGSPAAEVAEPVTMRRGPSIVVVSAMDTNRKLWSRRLGDAGATTVAVAELAAIPAHGPSTASLVVVDATRGPLDPHTAAIAARVSKHGLVAIVRASVVTGAELNRVPTFAVPLTPSDFDDIVRLAIGRAEMAR